MPRRFELYLNDMLESIQSIETYISDQTKASFFGDKMRFDAVRRNLEVLGEVAKGIRPEVRREAPEVPWREPGRLRDSLIHHYFGMNRNLIWHTIQNRLPVYKKSIVLLVRDLGKRIPPDPS